MNFPPLESQKGSALRGARGKLGFTLIELLVVIAIIAILAAMLLPSLAKAKVAGQGVSCLNNMKQLQLGWYMYADDYKGILPVNTSDGGSPPGETLDSPSWVAGVMSTAGGTLDNTNTQKLVGQPYQPFGSIGGMTINPGVYHCPGDQSMDSQYGPRVRSVSMNGWMSPGTGGSTSDNALKSSYYKAFLKLNDLTTLPPSSAIVFLDERAQSINEGWFDISVGFYNNSFYEGGWSAAYADIADAPAIYHNNASAFSFADGHGEIHHWLDSRTLAFTGAAQISANNMDCVWLTTHGTVPKIISQVPIDPSR